MRLYRDREAKCWVVTGATVSDALLLAKARFALDKSGRRTGVRGAWWTAAKHKAAKLASVGDLSCRDDLIAFAKNRDYTIEQSRASEARFHIPAPEGFEYRPFQQAGVRYMHDKPCVLLGDEMGLGKTIQILALINLLKPRTVLGVVPANLKINWKREAELWLTDERTILIIDSKTHPEVLEDLDARGKPYLALINYDITSKGSNYKITGDDSSLVLGPFDTWLRSKKRDLVFFDEAHKLKSPNARRTISLLGRDRIPKRRSRGRIFPEQPAIPPVPASRLIMATGTPIPNRPIEAQPLLGRLRKEFSNYWAFARLYCAAHNNGFGVDVSGASNMSELQERLRSTVMIRRLKKDVLTELPSKVRQVIDLPSDGMSKIIKAEKTVMTKSSTTIKLLRAEVRKAHAEWRRSGSQDEKLRRAHQQAVQALQDGLQVAFREMSIVRRDTAIAKIPKVIEYVKGMFEGGVEKVVVMAHHRQVIEDVSAAFADSVKLYGGMSATAKDRAVNSFQGDPTCQLFVGSIQAAGVGLTLTAASHVVFAELDWVPANVSQAEDRCHRMGQQDSVLVQHLVINGSIDSTIAKRIVEKQKVIDQGLDIVDTGNVQDGFFGS